ncbi:MAG: hypothetical protein AB1766_11845 [Pseudomonadota bacterium]
MLARVEDLMRGTVTALRYLFILVMVVYLTLCIASLAVKLLPLFAQLGAPEFHDLMGVLNDALFTLIVIAVVRSLFVNDSFQYALTFLEVGFVVLMRKLILLDTAPHETWVLLVLGLISVMFFGLILYTHYLRKRPDNDLPAGNI